ncbi:serine-rich adhesin for platelets-like isoform X1 [Rana temporaria]|uniref:serine-rich adhesin for platelets-like isoform X1 n=1 Tax=Rana temporaria TaxID=8407 RepID=UPI001AAE1402|nr:serine-rich adhesin for platelets-like isoform X1 [Rana temporaria]
MNRFAWGCGVVQLPCRLERLSRRKGELCIGQRGGESAENGAHIKVLRTHRPERPEISSNDAAPDLAEAWEPRGDSKKPLRLRFGNTVKEETMRPPCDSETPGFDQLPFSSEESQRVMFVNKPRDDNHTIKFCKTNDVPIMDETMRLSSKSLSKPQEESDRSRASQTREENTVYSVEERNDLTFMNKGLNDNSVAVVTIDTVGGMLDNSANTSSQCNISSAEGKEPNSDNNYRQDANVFSSLENHSFIYGKMDNSPSLDTISENSSHLCIQPPTNVRIDSEPNEDTIERPDPVEGSQMNEADIVEDIYTDYSTAESDENSTNFALDDNDTVGSRLDESANACSEGNNFSPEITGLDNDNSNASGNPSSQMLKSHTSMGDKIRNDFMLDAGLKDSSPFSSWPHANVTVDSGPHVDTLGLENNVADNSSVLGTFGMDKSKGKKYSQDENNGPTISKADEEQNVVISRLDNYASAGSRGNPISEEDTEMDKTTYERDIGIFSSQDEINISRASKTEEQNVLSTYHDSIVLEKERATSSSQGSNGNSITTSSSQMLKICTIMVDKTDTSSSLSTRSKQPYPNVTVDSGLYEDSLERLKTGVTGLENNVTDNSSVLGTFGIDKTKGKKYSQESQDENNIPTISKADEEQNGLFVSQNAEVIENKYIATSSHEDDNPTTSGFIDYDAVNSKLDNCARSGGNPISEEDTKLDNTTCERDVGICSSQAENNISRASKTEEQNVLSTNHDSIVLEKESAASSSQGSNGNLINWTGLDDNYTVGVRLDNNANTSSQDNLSSAEAKEVESGGKCECGMDTSSSQVLKSCTSIVDKTDSSSSLNTQSKQPYLNVTVDSGLHEDTLERQKPDVTELENNVADNSSVLGTFGMDKTKGKKYSHESQDENNGPTNSKADEEQNTLLVSQNAEVNENKYIATSSHEDDNPTNSGFIDYDTVNSKLDNCASAGSRVNPISEEDTELDNTTCERDIGICSNQAENNISRASKTQEQNVLSTDCDSIVIEKESAASSSQGSNGNSINWTGLDDNYTVGVMLDNSANTSSQDNIKEVESGGKCERGMDTSSSQVLKSCTSMVDKTDTSSWLNTQSKQPYLNVTIDSGLHEDTLERQKPDVTGLENNVADNSSVLGTFGMDKTKKYSHESQDDNNGSTISEADEEQNGLFVSQNAEVIENKYIATSSHEDDNPTNSGFIDYDAVNSKLDNCASAGSRGNPISEEDTELLDNTTCERDIGIWSSQDEINISRASKTEEQNVLSTDLDSIVIEKESAASSSQGSNGNLINWTGLDDNYTVGSRLDNSANTSIQDNIKEVESGGNCERGMDTSSSQTLKICTSMVDKTDTSSSLSTRSKQPYPNVTVDSGLYEDSLERQKTGVTGLVNNVADNSSVLGTFGMNKTKGKKYSHEFQDENNRPTISEADKEQNGLFVSQNAKVNENKYIATSSHEDDNPTHSGFINHDAVNSKFDNCARSRDNPIFEEDTELDKTTYEPDVGIWSNQDEINISRASKPEEQNVLSTDHDSIVIEKESAAFSSQGSNGNSINWTGLHENYTVGSRLENSANTSIQDNIKEVESGGNCECGMDTSSSQTLKICTSLVDKTDTSSSLNTQSKQPYPNVTVDSELHETSWKRQKPDVRGREFHPKDKALMSLTSENYNNKNENLSFESQGEMVPISLKTEQEEKELAETNDKNISYGSQDKEGPRGFKTKEEQCELNAGLDITKTKHIDYSKHTSYDDSENVSDAVVGRLDNSTNEDRRANTSSSLDTELDKKNNHGREIKIQSNQELLNPTSMGDKMASNCPLVTRPNKSSSFSKSYANAIEDSELHEDTIEEQKPVVRDSESLVEDKTFTDLELPSGISSDSEPEYQVSKINNTNIDTFLGNEVDFKASETQTLDNSPFVGNQFNRFPSSGTLHMVPASVLKSRKSSKSQNTNDATRQSHRKLKIKVRRQKSQKLVRNPKSNIQDKSKRVLQPKRGEKAFNETNREKRTPIAYTPEDDARSFKVNSYKEKEIVTRMNQSMESIRLMISEKLKGSWAAVVKLLVLLWLCHHCVIPVGATPIQPTPELPLTQWRRHTFCTDGYPLINETLIINMEHRTDPGCMFRAPAVPYFYNCSKFNALVFFINATCLEMFTTYLQIWSWVLEYGAVYHGKDLTSVRGELFPHEHVMAKVHQYEGGDGPQGRSYIPATPTPLFTNGTTSEPLDRPTRSRIFCLLPIIAVTLLVLVLLGYYFLKRCKNKPKTPSPTSNGIELQVNKQDGDDTNRGLLSNGTSEPPTQEPEG